MPNIYLNVLLRKALLRKSDMLKTSIFKVEKVHIQVSFGGVLTIVDIIEFSNFLLQLKIRGLRAKLCVNFLLF